MAWRTRSRVFVARSTLLRNMIRIMLTPRTLHRRPIVSCRVVVRVMARVFVHGGMRNSTIIKCHEIV